jgi:hypothetical protein
MSVTVTMMVCPLCARMHGRPHSAGCPESFAAPPEYLTGWIAARNALVPPLCDEITDLQETLRLASATGDLGSPPDSDSARPVVGEGADEPNAGDEQSSSSAEEGQT